MAITYHAGERIQGLSPTLSTDVVWQNMTDGHSAVGNVLSKSGANWTADATGTTTFSSTVGKKVEFTVSANTSDSFCGFDISTNTDSYNMDYALYCGGAGTINIYANGSQVSATGVTYTTSDTLAVNMDSSGTVTFLKNGSVFYTSLTTASGTYRVNAVIYTSGVSITANLITAQDVKPTNVPDYSRFEETDTRKIYTKLPLGWYELGTVFPLNSTRGLFGGGYSGAISNIIDYITIATTGNATDFGDLLSAKYGMSGATSSETRGVWQGDHTNANVIQYVTIATPSNATDFGDLTVGRGSLGGLSDKSRGVAAGGNSSTGVNTIDYITIATTGNATDFGDISVTAYDVVGVGGTTRGLIALGYTGAVSNIIEYITIQTTGNSTDFGDLTVARNAVSGTSDNSRAIFAGGEASGQHNVIDYVTVSTTGNATDFGDLSNSVRETAAVSNNTRGLISGGYNGSTRINVIDYITIATLGNATDFGDLTLGRGSHGGCDGV